ncbi:hypothetical protein AN958_06931 [Leucoagaricus sp. SymC.cos]|nr:hypothetical protein AN958_06931 [Leucoagaricus sp. SymC.cos]
MSVMKPHTNIQNHKQDPVNVELVTCSNHDTPRGTRERIINDFETFRVMTGKTHSHCLKYAPVPMPPNEGIKSTLIRSNEASPS